jgi:hypothetical protein
VTGGASGLSPGKNLSVLRSPSNPRGNQLNKVAVAGLCHTTAYCNHVLERRAACEAS